MTLTVTFDVFSALTDSRSGGSAFLESVVGEHGWPVSGVQLYDRWDALNKERHRSVDRWVPFAELSILAVSDALEQLELPQFDATRISRDLMESMVEWPLWPDVDASSLAALGATGLGMLTNIDDQLLAGTAVMRLGVFEPGLIVTSQRAQAYKPAEALYRRAGELLGPYVHVASSARDVRGAVSAGVACVRLARRGHSLDAAGPEPQWTADSMSQLPALVAAASAASAARE